TANPTSLVADGASTSTITVQVNDANGNPVAAGVDVFLALSAGPGTLSAGPWQTTASGQVTATVTAPTAVGSGTVTAYLGTDATGSQIGTATVTYLAGA